MPREKHGQVGDPLKPPVKDKEVNADVVDESAFFCSLLNTIKLYIDFTRYKTRHTVVLIPFAEKGSTTAFIRTK